MLQPFFGAQVSAGFLDTGVKPGDKTGDDVVNTQFNGNFVAACQAAQKMIVADDNAMTVTMTLKQPWGPFLPSIANAWGSILDAKWVQAQGGWDGGRHDPPVRSYTDTLRGNIAKHYQNYDNKRKR